MRRSFFAASGAMGALVLVLVLAYWFDVPGVHGFLGAINDAFTQVFGALFVGAKILFFTGLAYVVGYGVLDLRKRSKVTIIAPTKYGPVQAIQQADGNWLQLQSPATQLDPMQQMNMLKSVMQMQSHMARLAKTTVVDEVAPTDTAKQIAPPTGPTLHLSDEYRVPVDDVLSGRILIVGQSGSGKSNTIGVFGEELGRLEVPLTLADTEDEYQPLLEYFPRGMLAGATGVNSVTVENAYNFGQYVLIEMRQVILNLQSYDEMSEAALVMVKMIQGMRDWEAARSNENRLPSAFILEEAVTWLPQNIKESPLYGTEALNSLQGTFFNDMVRKGRKRGLGLVVVCQKIAEIDKRALQADAKILHYQNEGPDLERYAQKFGIKNEETLSLQRGDAFLFTARMSKLRIHVRQRYSKHGADTPGMENLQRYQRSRTFGEPTPELWRTSEPSNLVRPRFGAHQEPVREDEDGSAFAGKSAQRDIPPELRTEIADLYRGGMGRKKIQAQLHIAGDQFWQLRDICDEVDREQQAERA